MGSIAIRSLSFLLPYSMRNNSGIPNNRGERGLENVLKINNQKDWDNLGVSKIEAIYISISCFHTFFQILRKTLKKKIANNVDLT